MFSASKSGQYPGYLISRSVRLRSSASAYLTRTPASAGNRQTWTWSGWVKRGTLGANLSLMGAQANASSGTQRFNMYYTASTDTLSVYDDSINISTSLQLITTQVFRDPSAWYHVVLAADTTQATASNRLKLYINGTQVTAFNAASYPTQNFNTAVNNNVAQYIGYYNNLGTTIFYFDGYITEVNFIDGQALTPSSFGVTNAYGVWSPIKYNGTYGTNGFYLNFADNSNNTAATIGKDSSGNGNNWTPNNISVTAGVTYDSMLDVPTPWGDGGNGRGNYCVMNPLKTGGIVASNGNLTITGSASSTSTIVGTMGVTSGKWYWEYTVGSTDQNSMIGICTDAVTISNYVGADANGWAYYGVNGNKYNAGTAVAYGASYTNADVIGVAFDADNGTLTFYKNNVSQGTAYTGLTSGPYFPAIGDSGTAAVPTGSFNFGQRPFSYTPPSGFKALNTLNLPTPTIAKGNQYFDATLWTGDGASSRAITNTAGFQPDLVWVKNRSAGWGHRLSNSVVGANYALESNNTAAELFQNQYGYLSSFNTNGFTLQAGSTDDYYTNNNGEAYVGWQWKEGATQGFDIVTYTGDGTSNRQISHSLGVAPAMIIVKVRSTTNNWRVWHQRLTGSTYYLGLNQTAAEATSATVFNGQSSTTFTVGNDPSVNVNAGTFVAYLFAEVAGFSRFGSYTGNGSTDGPFVYTGFRPAFVMIKSSSSASGNWLIQNNKTLGYNPSNSELYANLSNAETTADRTDLLSNGFKPRINSAENNSSGVTYIYAAFAESPFKFALAR